MASFNSVQGKQVRPSSAAQPIRLAIWYGKGGVGKSTTTIMLALLAAERGASVLVIDLDPECGTSRDFLGKALPQTQVNLRAFLESEGPPLLTPIPSGVPRLDLVPSRPDEQRFFRHYPEHSLKLREGLLLSASHYDWIIMDTPNQFDNVAELGLIASDYVLLPIELSTDCVERVGSALRIIREARALNPALTVIGALALGSSPESRRERKLSAKEHMIYDEYRNAFKEEGIALFTTLMFRSATTVEEARSNANFSLMHWTGKRRFHSLFAEVKRRIRRARPPSSPTHHAKYHKPCRSATCRAPAVAR